MVDFLLRLERERPDDAHMGSDLLREKHSVGNIGKRAWR
jgi:hypothetical protein